MMNNENNPHQGHKHTDFANAADQLVDPVCGMRVTEQSPHHVKYLGREFYFCSTKC